MSATKFKVKQVKNDSETGLEAFVELPIDQEETTRLMPSGGSVDIGSSTFNWGDAYLGDLECGVISCLSINASNGDIPISTNLDVQGFITASSTISTSGVLVSNELRAQEGFGINITSDTNVIVDIDHNDNSLGGNYFKVRKDFEDPSGPVDLLTLAESGNLEVLGDISAASLSLTGEVSAADLSLSGSVSTDLSLDGKLEASGEDPLIIDASSVVIENSKTANTSSVTLRDSINANSSISLIEGEGLFGEASNYGFQLEYNGRLMPNSLSLRSGYGTLTADIFTVVRDVSGVPSSDIEFKGLITSDNDTAAEQGGVRSTYFGGGPGSQNAIRLTTVDGNGNFNPHTTDTGTFYVNGPKGDDGKLSIEAFDIDLVTDGHVRVALDHNSNGTFQVKDSNNDIVFRARTGTVDRLLVESSLETAIDNATVSNNNSLRLLVVDPTGHIYKSDENSHLLLNAPFTGTHVYASADELPLGSSVSLDAGTLALTTSASQANCVGIVQSKELATEDSPHTTSLGEVITSGNIYYVAAVGDSIKGGLRGFKVCNEGGDISAGDLLVTSSVSGRLMKQADDVVRASTVGKAMQSVTFNDQGQADNVYGFLYCG